MKKLLLASTCLTWVGSANAVVQQVVMGDTNFTAAIDTINVTTRVPFTAPRTLTLPASAGTCIGQLPVDQCKGFAFGVFDTASAISALNTLTIVPAPGNTINGSSASLVLSTPGTSLALVPTSGTNWMVSYNSASQNPVVNVMDFGAVGNDLNRDESPFINNAIAFAHNLGIFGAFGTLQPIQIYFPPRQFFVDHSINMTRWSATAPVQQSNGPAVTVMGYGAYIWARNQFDAGKPIIDAMGSSLIRWEGLSLYGNNCAGAPSTGIQIGVVRNNFTAGTHTFNNVNIWGCYALTPFYNLASEVNSYYNLNILLQGGGAQYGAILDGTNHFNIQSDFVSGGVVVSGHQSFTATRFFGGAITTSVGVSPTASLWIASDVEDLLMEGTYLNNGAASGLCIQHNTEAPSSAFSGPYRLFIHCEASNLANTISFTASTAATVASVQGLRLSDEALFATQSILKVGTNVTAVSLRDFEPQIQRFVNGASGRVFDDATKYTASGMASVPAAANWVQPLIWQGCVTINTNSVRTCTNATMAVGAGTTVPVMSTGEMAISKITASGTAPGAGNCKLSVVAGTSGGTCKLIAYCGTSTTPATILDNIGGGC